MNKMKKSELRNIIREAIAEIIEQQEKMDMRNQNPKPPIVKKEPTRNTVSNNRPSDSEEMTPNKGDKVTIDPKLKRAVMKFGSTGGNKILKFITDIAKDQGIRKLGGDDGNKIDPVKGIRPNIVSQLPSAHQQTLGRLAYMMENASFWYPNGYVWPPMYSLNESKKSQKPLIFEQTGTGIIWPPIVQTSGGWLGSFTGWYTGLSTLGQAGAMLAVFAVSQYIIEWFDGDGNWTGVGEGGWISEMFGGLWDMFAQIWGGASWQQISGIEFPDDELDPGMEEEESVPVYDQYGNCIHFCENAVDNYFDNLDNSGYFIDNPDNFDFNFPQGPAGPGGFEGFGDDFYDIFDYEGDDGPTGSVEVGDIIYGGLAGYWDEFGNFIDNFGTDWGPSPFGSGDDDVT